LNEPDRLHCIPRIAVLGCGNMGRSLLAGLLDRGCQPERIRGAEADADIRRELRRRWRLRVFSNAREAVKDAGVVILAVKPGQLERLVTGIADTVAEDALIISIAAGIRLGRIRGWLGAPRFLVRAMPNLPARVREGVTALYAGRRLPLPHRRTAETVMGAVGKALWLERESQMEAVTAISGSGPAYFLLLMELMEANAVQLGLPPRKARTLVLRTARGAAELALRERADPGELRRRVTSPGGTTEAALRVLRKGGIEALLARALRAAWERSSELAGVSGDKR